MDEPVKTESKEIVETREAKRRRVEFAKKIREVVATAPEDITVIVAVANEGGVSTKIYSRQGTSAIVSAYVAVAQRVQEILRGAPNG